MLTDGLDCEVFISCLDSDSDGTHSLQLFGLWFWRHPFTAAVWTLILTAPIHCSCLDSDSDGTHSLQLFGLWFWRHPFTAAVWTLILTAPIHCRLSKLCNDTFLFWWRNKLIYILDGLRVNFQQICIFRQTIALKPRIVI